VGRLEPRDPSTRTVAPAVTGADAATSSDPPRMDVPPRGYTVAVDDASNTRVRVGALTFDVFEGGSPDGEPVLFLHGFPQTGSAWLPMMRSLASSGRRLIAPTQRGYTSTARPTRRGAYATGQLVDDVLSIADALGCEQFDLVGHDWGGAIGWVLAVEQADRVRTFTSLATPHPAAMAEAMLGGQALRSAYAAFFQLPVLPELLLGAGGNTALRVMLERSGLSAATSRAYADALDAPALHAALQWYREADVARLARLGDVTVPTLYVWGNRDAALGRVAARRTAGHVAGSYRFEELNVTHWLPEECPTVVAALIDTHLRQHQGADAR
jgi:pimeloyl-ACP methyl ester carboxylesterase